MRNNRKRLLLLMTYRGLWRVGLAVLLFGIAAVALMSQLGSDQSWTSWSLPLSGKTVYIDPGHGGRDGGAVSRTGITEKEVNLAISLFLRDYLQEAGALVYMTREGDYDLADPDARRRKTQDLHRRAERVNEAQADYLVSIHMNAMVSSRWRGAQTFYDEQGGEESRMLANLIQEELIQGLGNTKRMAKTVPNIYLLKTAEMPAALVEAGFLSNPEEAAMLADPAYQKKVAAAVYRGILRYASGEKLQHDS